MVFWRNLRLAVILGTCNLVKNKPFDSINYKKIVLMNKYLTFALLVALHASTYAQCWKSIDGRLITSAVKMDGTLWGWGNNQYGQLGNGTVNQANFTPVQIGNEADWSSVAVSDRNTFGIKTDGTLWAWGNNLAGQMGIPNLSETTVPVQVGTDTDWLTVSAATTHTLAIKSNGTLWAWGNNSYGQLGNGTNIPQSYPVQISSSNWLSVSAGNSRSHAIKADGTLWAWGYNFSGALGDGTSVFSRNSPVQIGIGLWQSVDNRSNDHVLGIKADGTLWAWGKSSYGALGNGSNEGSNLPIQIGNDTWRQVSVGVEHSLAIKLDGTLWSWGKGNFGELGTGTTNITNNVPLQVGTANDWSDVKGAFGHSMAFKNDGSFWVWGGNYSGQLGVSAPDRQTTPLLLACPAALEIHSFKQDAFSLTPNPASSTISLHYSNDLIIDEIIIYDALGKIVERKNEKFENIEIRNLQNGIYFLKAFSDGNVLNVRFIKN